MRWTILMIFLIPSFFTAFAACNNGSKGSPAQSNSNDTTTNKMKIKIGSKTFTASLFNNPTVAAFKEMLPLTLNMTELNGNEKYFHLSTSLPTNASNPGTIHSGDLMLWGSNSLVLFYQTFSTSYSYTKLGRFNDIEDLAAAVGSGSVIVTFEME